MCKHPNKREKIKKKVSGLDASISTLASKAGKSINFVILCVCLFLKKFFCEIN